MDEISIKYLFGNVYFYCILPRADYVTIDILNLPSTGLFLCLFLFLLALP